MFLSHWLHRLIPSDSWPYRLIRQLFIHRFSVAERWWNLPLGEAKAKRLTIEIREMSWGSVFWVARRPRHAALLETMANDNRNASFAVFFSGVFLCFPQSSKVPKVHIKMWIFTGTLAILCWIFNQKGWVDSPNGFDVPKNQRLLYGWMSYLNIS